MAFLQIDYKSEALMRGVNIKVILPSDGMAGKWEPPYKTLYLLPGYSATAYCRMARICSIRTYLTV